MTFGVVMLRVTSLGCGDQSRDQSDGELRDHVAWSFESDSLEMAYLFSFSEVRISYFPWLSLMMQNCRELSRIGVGMSLNSDRTSEDLRSVMRNRFANE